VTRCGAFFPGLAAKVVWEMSHSTSSREPDKSAELNEDHGVSKLLQSVNGWCDTDISFTVLSGTNDVFISCFKEEKSRTIVN